MQEPPAEPLVLIVDDDPHTCVLVARWLGGAGYRTESHSDAESLMDALSRSLPDAVLLDVGLPGMSGLDVLPLIRERHRTVPVLMLTGDTQVTSVVEAVQKGAHDYVAKPPQKARLLTAVRNATEQHRMTTRLAQLERELEGDDFAGMLGRSLPMRALFRQLERVAASDITVLVRGESGTGKELAAHAIHDQSARRRGPFVAVNCAGVPESLQDSELFGHERGAFTGAVTRRVGRFEQADGGTLFLDEVAELSLPLQAKLLRVLQERQFERLGGNKTLRSDFRLLTATHRDLRQMVRDREFREDLYFRIAVFDLDLPPLRARVGDIELLAKRLLESHRFSGGPELSLSARALGVLESYDWPGNVRELDNVLARATVVAEGGVVLPEHLPPRLLDPGLDGDHGPVSGAQSIPMCDVGGAPLTLDELERCAIESEMKRVDGNIAAVVQNLGIGRTTLYRKLKKYGLR